MGLLEVMQYQCLEPDVITYNAAISACDKAKQPDMQRRSLW